VRAFTPSQKEALEKLFSGYGTVKRVMLLGKFARVYMGKPLDVALVRRAVRATRREGRWAGRTHAFAGVLLTYGASCNRFCRRSQDWTAPSSATGSCP
jgi:hypothetical protein